MLMRIFSVTSLHFLKELRPLDEKFLIIGKECVDLCRKQSSYVQDEEIHRLLSQESAVWSPLIPFDFTDFKVLSNFSIWNAWNCFKYYDSGMSHCRSYSHFPCAGASFRYWRHSFILMFGYKQFRINRRLYLY